MGEVTFTVRSNVQKGDSMSEFKANKEMRNALKRKGIPLWKIAEGLGVSEWTLGRWLRHDVDEELDRRIRNVVESILSEVES